MWAVFNLTRYWEVNHTSHFGLYETRQTREDLTSICNSYCNSVKKQKRKRKREMAEESAMNKTHWNNKREIPEESRGQSTNYKFDNENCCQFTRAKSSASKAEVFERTNCESRRQGKYHCRSWAKWKAKKFIAYSHVQFLLLHPKSQRLPHWKRQEIIRGRDQWACDRHLQTAGFLWNIVQQNEK